MFPNLRAELARKNITGRTLAKALNITNDSVSNKMNGKTEFTRAEIFKIRDEFFSDLNLDYLFETKEEDQIN